MGIRGPAVTTGIDDVAGDDRSSAASAIDGEVYPPRNIPADSDSAQALRRRIVHGASVLLGRGVLIKAVGFVGSLVLARILTPEQFGRAAIGMTALVAGGVLSDGGLGVGFIRRAAEPSKAELSAVLGFQLAIALATVMIGGVIAVFGGDTARVTALTLAALPFHAARAPATIRCERDLRYRPLATAEVCEAVAFTATSLALAYAGLGAWSIALAFVARGVTGFIALWWRVPGTFVIPRIALTPLRGQLRYGLTFQTAGVASLVRDEGLNVMTAVIAGLPALGVWSVCRRIVQVPFVLFESLWRVTFPGFVKMIDASLDMSAELRRMLRWTSYATGVALIGLASSAPTLLPAILGHHRWSGVAESVVIAIGGLALSGPVSTTFAGYLYAVGRARSVLAAIVLPGAVWLVTAGVLLHPLGAVGVAIGWAAASSLEAVMLVRATRRQVRVDLRVLIGPLVSFAACAAASLLFTRGSSGLPIGLIAFGTSTAVYGSLALAIDPAFRSGVATFSRSRRPR